MSDLLLSNWSHLMLSLSLEFHPSFEKCPQRPCVSAQCIFWREKNALLEYFHPFPVRQKHCKSWLKIFHCLLLLFIVKHFQIHDELQAPEWTEKGPLKRDWHGTTKMITFQTHEKEVANDMKMEQLRWSHSNDMKMITPNDMEIIRFQQHEKWLFELVCTNINNI